MIIFPPGNGDFSSEHWRRQSPPVPNEGRVL